jgi:hypothetical protein
MVVYPAIMDRQPGSPGVYVVRRIVAALVILLVLALLIPQAWQALRGPGDTRSRTQDTAEMDSSNDSSGDEENATNEKSVSSPANVAQREDASADQVASSETGAGGPITTGAAESSEDISTAENTEIAAEPAETEEVLEEAPVSEVAQIAPLPVIDTGAQLAIQPISFLQEPMAPVEPIAPVVPSVPLEPVIPIELAVPAEPITFEGFIVPDEPIYYFEDPAYDDYLAYYDYPAYYDYLAYYEDSAYYDYSAYYENLAYYDYPGYYEEQIFEEPDALDTGATVALETRSNERGGGSGAYAAISAD